MKTNLKPIVVAAFAAFLLSCQAWPANADTAVKDAQPVVASADKHSDNIVPPAEDVHKRADTVDKKVDGKVPAALKDEVKVETDGLRKDSKDILSENSLLKKDLAVLKSKLEDAQKFEDFQAKVIQDAKDADNKETKLWLRILGSALVLAGGIGAYLFAKTGSFIRAIACGAVGFVFGLGLFVAAAYWTLVVYIIIGTAVLAALISLFALVMHYRKHFGLASQKYDHASKTVEGMLEVAASTVSGAIGVGDMTNKDYWSALYAEHGRAIGDSLWEQAKKMGIKLPE